MQIRSIYSTTTIVMKMESFRTTKYLGRNFFKMLLKFIIRYTGACAVDEHIQFLICLSDVNVVIVALSL